MNQPLIQSVDVRQALLDSARLILQDRPTTHLIILIDPHFDIGASITETICSEFLKGTDVKANEWLANYRKHETSIGGFALTNKEASILSVWIEETLDIKCVLRVQILLDTPLSVQDFRLWTVHSPRQPNQLADLEYHLVHHKSATTLT